LKHLTKHLLCALLCALGALGAKPAQALDILLTPADNVAGFLRAAKPGDTFLLSDGAYPGGIYVSDKPATQLLPITVKAVVAGKAILQGSSPTRVDALATLRCPYWRFEGLTFQGAARAGLQIGSSDHTVVTSCVSRLNGVQGILASGNYGTIEDTECSQSGEQHGVYVTGATKGWRVRRCRFYRNAGNGIQFNNQGSGGVVSDALVQDCSIWGNGRAGGAGINLIGVTNSRILNNSIHDNLASGIALSGGSNGNLLHQNFISFRGGQGRQCITSTDTLVVTNTVTSCVLRMGKSTVPAVEAKGMTTIVQADNSVLAVATATAESTTPTDTTGSTGTGT
jgi:parallel beta-helix repeat protein